MATGRPRVVTSRKEDLDLGDLSGPFLLALLGGDEAAAEGLVSRSRSRGADTALVVRDLVMPALCEVGRMWTRGEASIAEEHLATALVSRVLARSSGGAAIRAGSARRIVFACLAGEFHDLGIRFLADVARESGWDAESLGANVPRESLVHFVQQRPPPPSRCRFPWRVTSRRRPRRSQRSARRRPASRSSWAASPSGRIPRGSPSQGPTRASPTP
ncbi:MAG: B12-binding domain-containing protein [Holophagales bacterium]|nr:B12-binding domain-containing protein [Holophagales bacterium]